MPSILLEPTSVYLPPVTGTPRSTALLSLLVDPWTPLMPACCIHSLYISFGISVRPSGLKTETVKLVSILPLNVALALMYYLPFWIAIPSRSYEKSATREGKYLFFFVSPSRRFLPSLRGQTNLTSFYTRLTAAEVAKPEYRSLFGLEAERPDSVASLRTVKPKKSFKSLKSVPSFASIASVIPTYDHVPPLPLDDLIPPSVSIIPLLDQLFDDLRFVSRALPTTYSEADFDALEDHLSDVVGMGNMLITLARDPVEAAAGSLREAQSSVGRISGLLNNVSKEIEDKLEIRTGAMVRWGESAIQARRRTTDSGSSGTTAVSQRSRTMSGSTKLGSSTDLSEVSGEELKERSIVSGTERLKKWFKKKLNVFPSLTASPPPIVVPPEPSGEREEWEGTRGLALRSSDRVLDAASRDLINIEECMTMVSPIFYPLNLLVFLLCPWEIELTLTLFTYPHLLSVHAV